MNTTNTQNPSATISQPVANNTISPVIQIGQMEAIIGIVVFLVGLGISWGTLTTKLSHISEAIKDKIEPDLKDVRERFAIFEGKSAHLFGASSPISLLQKGNEMLQISGLKKYIDDNKETLFGEFNKTCVIKNQYDIQEQSFIFFDEFDFKDFDVNLKKISFDHGINIATLRRIGGIYFRDLVLAREGFSPSDLDKPDHKK